MSLGSKKLVILGIPWEVDTEGLRQYMSQYGELVEVMVVKDRASGRSRGFGYATFSSSQDAEKALASKHVLNGRMLDVKVATPKEEMAPTKKDARVFVARIPFSVTDEDFHSYFMKYGPIIDAYMPKDPVTKQHRGIGFVTYKNSESVVQLIPESHKLGGSTIAVDRATPKEGSRMHKFSSHYVESKPRFSSSHSVAFHGIDTCGGIAKETSQAVKLQSSNVCLTQEGLAIKHAVVSRDTSSDVVASSRVGKRLFIGRVPIETTSEDLMAYFSQFGWVTDAYLPKDARKTSHRGFAFVTFADEASAARVTRRRHYIHGREIAIDSASPTDGASGHGPLGSSAASISESEQNNHSGIPGVVAENSGLSPPSGPNLKWGKKLFIGRIPAEATAIDLKLHFSQFGHVVDVYLPKDDKKTSHRGFGFITFADDISAEYASQRVHRILGQKVVLDRAAPLENEVSDANAKSDVSTGGTLLDGAISALQDLSTQHIYDAKLIQPQTTSLSRPLRIASRYRPY